MDKPFTCDNCGKLGVDEVEYNVIYSSTDAYTIDSVEEGIDGISVISVTFREGYPGDTEDSYFDCTHCSSSVKFEFDGNYEIEYN
jgi:hypothetical protein